MRTVDVFSIREPLGHKRAPPSALSHPPSPPSLHEVTLLCVN